MREKLCLLAEKIRLITQANGADDDAPISDDDA
jgi:hypothetical protein